jgi:hypothetical protein
VNCGVSYPWEAGLRLVGSQSMQVLDHVCWPGGSGPEVRQSIMAGAHGNEPCSQEVQTLAGHRLQWSGVQVLRLNSRLSQIICCHLLTIQPSGFQHFVPIIKSQSKM